MKKNLLDLIKQYEIDLSFLACELEQEFDICTDAKYHLLFNIICDLKKLLGVL